MTNEHTGEGIELTEQWVAKHGMTYAYAYFEGNALPNAVAQRAYPHAALVDPNGTVVWSGHPSGLSDALIESHLEGAIARPIFEWDDAVAKVVEALRARELGTALKEARKLAKKGVADSDVALATAQQLVDAAVASVVGTFEEGNFLDASINAERYAKQLKGLEVEARLDEIIEQCKNDETAKSVLKAQQKLRGLLGKRLRKKRDADSLIAKLREMATEFEGTYVVVEAERAIAALERKRESLR